jgi:hypothetical protein
MFPGNDKNEYHVLPLSGIWQHQHHRVRLSFHEFRRSSKYHFPSFSLCMADLLLRFYHQHQRKSRAKTEDHEKMFPLDIRCCIFSAFFPLDD